MKPDYQNWIPDRLLYATYLAAFVSFAGLWIGLTGFEGFERTFSAWFFGIAFAILAAASFVMRRLHKAFDFEGDEQVSRRIIERVAERAKLPDGGRGLDIGCGSAPLTVSLALKHPKAEMTGLDLWPRGFSSFSQALCERNAKAEGASNARFVQGDAKALPFPDETFDLVVSNYLFTSVQTLSKGSLILEALRVLKKGGTFVLHDYFLRKGKFGDMEALCEKLKKEGFRKAEIIPTAEGLFLDRKEAWRLNLTGSALFIGKK